MKRQKEIPKYQTIGWFWFFWLLTICRPFRVRLVPELFLKGKQRGCIVFFFPLVFSGFLFKNRFTVLKPCCAYCTWQLCYAWPPRKLRTRLMCPMLMPIFLVLHWSRSLTGVWNHGRCSVLFIAPICCISVSPTIVITNSRYVLPEIYIWLEIERQANSKYRPEG